MSCVLWHSCGEMRLGRDRVGRIVVMLGVESQTRQTGKLLPGAIAVLEL